MKESYRGRKWETRGAGPNARARQQWRVLGLTCALGVSLAGSHGAARAASAEWTRVNVLVKDAETDQPIYQARLTLQFREPGSVAKLKRSKLISFSAKTDAQGRYRFIRIPKGTVRLIVTSEHHQTFSKEFEVERDNQVLEVKLKKPQPLL